jgi:hypothetical protein
MRIYDRSGNQIGKVGGNRSLISDDEDLRRVFQERVAGIVRPSPEEWLETAGKILTQAGYRVVIYDEG